MGEVRRFRSRRAGSAQPRQAARVKRVEAVSPLPRGRGLPHDNLPLQLTRLIGREDELQRVRSLLGSERLVTLTGTGGIGKTRLALESAAQAADEFRDGVWLINLAALAEPALVIQAVAEPLGVRAEAESPLQETLIEFLRARQVLLVLDNCEHLVQACATLAEALLRACPDLRILATSREPLRVAGETAWRVPPLSIPNEAVRLFVERASSTGEFVLTKGNSATVARVCQQLEGIPLAIELAAARSSVLSVEQIASRLKDRFRLLVGGSRTAPARHQTLRATIDWSFDLLTPMEQLLLCRLSIFAGGWSLEAAESISAGDGIPASDVFTLLAQLVDKSLVLAEAGPQGLEHNRYRLLDSVRQYAQGRLDAAGATLDLHRRHAEYYAALAADVEARILWGTQGVEWLAALDRELGNLRAALGWSVSGEGDPMAGLNLAAHLGHYWYTRGDRAEGRAWLGRALKSTSKIDFRRRTADDAGAAATYAWALLWAGGLAHGQSDYEQAVPLLQQALQRFEQLDDQRGIGWTLSFLGHVARARRDLQHAADFLERSVAAFWTIGDELSTILPLAALGFTACLIGQQERATQLLEQSVALARQMQSHGRLALALIYSGQVAFAQGDAGRAVVVLREGLKLSREWDSAWGMAECLEGLAVVAGADGRADRAARLLGAAATLRETIGAAVHPVDRTDHDRTVAAIEASIGAANMHAAWKAGRSMPLDEVIDFAVAEPGPIEQPRRGADALSPREREVATQIAAGLTNRQIANTLVISERTVTSHVEHILNKLGFQSRAQIATWITELRLTAER